MSDLQFEAWLIYTYTVSINNSCPLTAWPRNVCRCKVHLRPSQIICQSYEIVVQMKNNRNCISNGIMSVNIYIYTYKTPLTFREFYAFDNIIVCHRFFAFVIVDYYYWQMWNYMFNDYIINSLVGALDAISHDLYV